MKRFTTTVLLSLAAFSLRTVTQATVISGPIENPANHHLYYLLSPGTWTASQAQAMALGGNLVTINDAAENAWVSGQFLNYGGINRDLWIGLTDAGTEGNFRWVSGDPFTYSNWMPGQPDNGSIYWPFEDYVHIYGGTTTEHVSGWFPGGWNDVQDWDSYYSNSGTYRVFSGVVEVVPEPTVSALVLTAASLFLCFRRRQ